MTGTLIINLSAKMTWDWIIFDKNQMIQSESSLLDIPKIKDFPVILIIPGCDVFLTELSFPPVSNSRLKKAVPFALEDRLADNIDNLHFVINRTGKNSDLSVAVVSKSTMEKWHTFLLQLFKPYRPRLQAILPSALAIPCAPHAWAICKDDNMALVRMSAHIGFAIEYDQLGFILRLLLKTSNHHPKIIEFFSNAPISEEEKYFLAQENISVQIKSVDNVFADMAKMVSQSQNIVVNLLEGSCYWVDKWISAFLSYRMTKILILCWIVIITVGDITKTLMLSYQNNKLTSQIVSVYSHLFPDKKFDSIDNAKSIMAQELISLKSHAVKFEFFTLLQNISPIIFAIHEIKINQLSYENSQLSLLLETNDFKLFDILRAKLISQGYKVEMNHIQHFDHFVQLTLTIRATP